jgi:hypothetical protein
LARGERCEGAVAAGADGDFDPAGVAQEGGGAEVELDGEAAVGELQGVDAEGRAHLRAAARGVVEAELEVFEGRDGAVLETELALVGEGRAHGALAHGGAAQGGENGGADQTDELACAHGIPL